MQSIPDQTRMPIFLLLLQTHGRVALNEVQVDLVAEKLTDVADAVSKGSPVSRPDEYSKEKP